MNFSLISKTTALAGLYIALGTLSVQAQQHPRYLHALSDLRAARWMIEHRPGNWQQTVDEVQAVQQIDAAIGEIKKLPSMMVRTWKITPVDDRPDHGGRLEVALDFLGKSRKDVALDEDNRFAQGLQARAYQHIDAAMGAVNKALKGVHPAYLNALSDLRAARWMIEHRPGDWQRTVDEVQAVQHIDAAIGEIKRAAIDDGKNLEDHPPVDERNDHMGRLHEAVDLLAKARQDISKDEGNQSVKGLQDRAYGHIDAAIAALKKAIHA